jgi:competence protein ComEC
LWPAPGYETDELNNTSMLVMVEYAGRRILLTGDIEAPGQRAVLASGANVQADVLKVPHHGAATSDNSFFDAVDAGVSVISVGEGNQFEHPRDETLEDLAGSTILRTDLDGRVTITVSSDGALHYSTER